MLGACLDEFEQANAGIGQARDIAIGPLKSLAAVAQLRIERVDAAGNSFARLEPVRGDIGESLTQGRNTFGQSLSLLGEGRDLRELCLAALRNSGVEESELLFELTSDFVLSGGEGARTLAGFVLESLVAFGDPLIDPRCLFGKCAELRICRLDGRFVDFLDLGHRLGEAGAHILDLVRPGSHSRIFAFANRTGDCHRLIAQGADALTHGRQGEFLVRARLFVHFCNFAAQGYRTCIERGQRFDFMAVQFVAELFAFCPQGSKALFGNGFELLGLLAECGHRVVDARPYVCDAALALAAVLLEGRKTFDQRIELFLCGAAHSADAIGNVLCRARDDRQIVPQLAHILERRLADSGNCIDLLAIVADQALQTIGIFGNPFGGAATEIFEVAGLAAEKFAGQAKLAVDDHQALFKPPRFFGKAVSNFPEPLGFMSGIARRQHPEAHDQEHRYCPGSGPGDTLLGSGTGKHFGAIGPEEKSGPSGYCQQRESGHDPSAFREDGFLLKPFRVFVFDFFGLFLFQRFRGFGSFRRGFLTFDDGNVRALCHLEDLPQSGRA